MVQKIIKAVLAVTAAALMIIYPKETAEAAVNGINVCLSSVIPSMFAFMVITSYIQSSGTYKIIFGPAMKLMRHIIKADNGMISVFILSLFGGYPIGIKLLKEISIAQNKNYYAIKRSCENAAAFCYCISPTFAIIMLGNGVFGSTEAGVVIYVSNILACIITGIIVSRRCDLKINEESESGTSGMTDAINSASRALFTICTVIVAFDTGLACINAFLDDLGASLPTVIEGELEITNLLHIKEPDISLIPLVSAISSFGGVCVLLQCCSIVKGAFSLKKFIAARIPCSLLSALISFIILQFTDISVTASTFSPSYTFDFSANKLIVLILTAMCIIIFYRSDKIFRKL